MIFPEESAEKAINAYCLSRCKLGKPEEVAACREWGTCPLWLRREGESIRRLELRVASSALNGACKRPQHGRKKGGAE